MPDSQIGIKCQSGDNHDAANDRPFGRLFTDIDPDQGCADNRFQGHDQADFRSRYKTRGDK